MGNLSFHKKRSRSSSGISFQYAEAIWLVAKAIWDPGIITCWERKLDLMPSKDITGGTLWGNKLNVGQKRHFK